MDEEQILVGVREYAEGFPVRLSRDEESGRLCFLANNQDGHDCTLIDAHDLLEWVANNPLPDSPSERKR